ncbi:hypothetical protein LCGC14_2313900, partial [marine sediment metagenome]
SQYYQRGVVDWKPAPGGGPHTFQRRLAWDFIGGGLGGSEDQGVEPGLLNPNSGDDLGPWGHKVSNLAVDGTETGFKGFFDRLGGRDSFGFPKTDARPDTHPDAVLHTPGKPKDDRIRQYFQSAVLEFHPDSPSDPVKLGLICDTGITLGHDLYGIMEADGLAQLFDHFTFSDQTGTTKPELRQFSHTLYRLDCPPESAVHVGDLEATDIAGAKQAGMRAVRIVHPDADPATAADATIRDIAEVLPVLRRWGVQV